MTELELMVQAFHFIRPLWLLLLPVVLVIWWRVRRGSQRTDKTVETLAPHLQAALRVGSGSKSKLEPIDGVATFLILIVLGVAGPTWSRMPDPFVAQSVPVVVLLEVTPSMQNSDIVPTRLERGKQKIRDLLELRGGARTALIGYAGSAHIAVPMTEDPSVVIPYLQGLVPDVMPTKGNRAATALELANELLQKEATPGAVLLVSDGLEADDAPTFNRFGLTSAVLTMLPASIQDRGLDQLNARKIAVSPDDSDIRQIDGFLSATYRQAMLDNANQPWEDRGHWFAWIAALLGLLWFRRGWTIRWAAAVSISMGIATSEPAHANGIMNWFLTPDQQGQVAYNRKDFGAAAEAFVDPLLRGYTLYRAGKYEDAVEVLARVETSQSAFIQGMAHIKSRSYRDGVRAFQTTLQRDPDFPNARENLAVAEQIVDYIERVRGQSDTGEERGIGADDVVLDNEEGRGADTQMEVPQEAGIALMSTEQWMRTVDTRTGDFLRQRFAIEETRRKGQGASQ